MNRRRWITASLVLGVIAVVAAGMLAGSAGGTDTAAVDQVAAQGYVPWATPLFSPGAGLEAGLFALQAGLGAVALAACVWGLRRRSRMRGGRPATSMQGAPRR